ncbi:HEPN domain-containing protein [Paenibacillus pabuli]|uniref:HEPN domain-containing protein n=1 Tax=Paenibacillus pabuli TaxID=1472 RepID=UPI001FFF4423|nr:HEPN domain-containing protein [Paenibacillus pabuli]UPK45270.1 hypothetical protein KET34_07225 [Paenibacillus pabuli]
MKQNLFATVRYFQLEVANTSLDMMSGLRLSNKETTISQILNNTIVENIGKISEKSLKDSIYIFCNGSEKRSIYDKLDMVGIEGEDEIFNVVKGFIQIFFTCLWLVKDNSAHIDSIFLNKSFENENETLEQTFHHITYLIFSTSRGDLQTNMFTIDEIKKALFYVSCFKEVDSLDEVNNIQFGYGLYNDLPYNNYSKLSRVHTLICTARKNSFIPIKISFYIATLECLFNTGSGEVTHMVCERTSLFLAGDLETRIKNYQLIKIAYDIRSKFIHGHQDMTSKRKTKESLQQISEELDSLIRQLMVLVITEKREILRLNNSKNEDKNSINQMFLELILE